MYSKNEEAVPLIEGTDYIVTYSNNIVAGKNAKIIFTGINKFNGKLEVKYTILPHLIEDNDVIPHEIGEIDYQKNKTTPSITVKVGNTILKEGRDYKTKYTNNTAVNDGSNSQKIPAVTITGIGNYSGTIHRPFTIRNSSLSNITMLVSDVVYADKPGTCKPTISLVDSNGTKLAAGKDYDAKNVAYRYVRDTEIEYVEGKVRY